MQGWRFDGQAQAVTRCMLHDDVGKDSVGMASFVRLVRWVMYGDAQ